VVISFPELIQFTTTNVVTFTQEHEEKLGVR